LGNFVDLESIFTFKSLIARKILPYTIDRLIKTHDSYLSVDFAQDYFLDKDFTLHLSKHNILFLVGLNLRVENPVLNSLIRRHSLTNDKFFVVSLACSLNYNYHVKSLGNNFKRFLKILKGKDSFSPFFTQSNSVVLLGNSASRRNDIASFHTLLTVVRTFMKICGKEFNFTFLKNGLTELNSLMLGLRDQNLQSIEKLNIDFTINYLYNTYTSDVLHKFFKGCNSRNLISIYQGHHYDPIIEQSFIILPGSSFVEKNGSYFNMFGNIKESKRVYFPPKSAKVDWQIFQFLLHLFSKVSFNPFIRGIQLNLVKVPQYKLDSARYTLINFIDSLLKTKSFLSVGLLRNEKSIFKVYSNIFSLREDLYSYVFPYSGGSFDVLKHITFKNVDVKHQTLKVINTGVVAFLNKSFSVDPITQSSLTLQMRTKLERMNFKNFM
jgi:hypothetical protein